MNLGQLMGQPMMALAGVATGLLALIFMVLAARSHRRKLRASSPRPIAVPTKNDGLGEEGENRFARVGSLLRPKNDKDIKELKSRISQAGLYSRDAMDLFLTIRLSTLFGGLVLSLMLISSVNEPPLAVLAFCFIMGLAFLAPGIWLGGRTKRRQMEVLRSLPSTVDLLVTCLEAGLGLEQALARVSEQGRFDDDLLSRELRITLAEIRAGLDVGTAFKKFSSRLGVEDVNTLAAVITQATALGTNIGSLLRDHARTMRQHRMLQMEERAGKANAKLTLPLTLCLLPSVLILLLGPAVIMMMNSL